MSKLPLRLSLMLIFVVVGFPSLANQPGSEDYQVDVRRLEITNKVHLFYRYYEPQQVESVIVLLHDLQAHSGWYTEACEILAQRGQAVYALDCRGAGMSQIEREDISDYQVFLSDLEQLIEVVQTEHPDRSIFLYGAGWGAKLALLYDSQNPGKIRGVILSSPTLYKEIDLGFFKKAKIWLTFWKKDKHQPEIMVPTNRSADFTDNPKWQKWIEQDPMTTRYYASGFYWENRKMTKAIKKEIRDCRAPALLLLGNRDRIIDVQKTIKYFRKKHPSSKQNRVMVLQFPSASHTLEFEENYAEMADQCVNWIRQNLP